MIWKILTVFGTVNLLFVATMIYLAVVFDIQILADPNRNAGLGFIHGFIGGMSLAAGIPGIMNERD